MESKRLFKKGELTETAAGEKLLVNEEGAAYGATDAMITVWNSFDGETVEEVALELSTTVNRNPRELIDGIGQMAAELEKADLLGT